MAEGNQKPIIALERKSWWEGVRLIEMNQEMTALW